MLERPSDIRLQLRRAVLVFATVTVLGALGYYIIERRNHWSVLDAIYMAVITVSTVGYTTIIGPGA